jgi:WD40 repeat protein/tRNA A-37 threonylcarbamoyl transferase component Bud32
MTPQQYQRMREVFHAANQRPVIEQVEYVRQACGSDAALREQVERLLRIERSESAFLESPVLGPMLETLEREVDEQINPAPVPISIGRYRILEVLGEGGMGTVYKAEQDHPRRIVALKVIRSDSLSRQMLRRFRHEAEVLGQLKHPGIAQIFETGTAESSSPHGAPPFFAMELVNGPSLLAFAEAHQLDARARLALMAGICDALHHAHQRGVIHRDLKPSNILVDELGQPKIVDFGIARATDSDVQTMTLKTDIGQLIGTVPYMSPEQAAGDPAGIDIRSDVYSLGVILYELLTSRLPYQVQGKMLHEAVRIIREDEPSRLSSIDRLFRGDVENILTKALEKDKERRYQSASELAADIRRHLSDEPIAARPATTLYQLRKFARRNRKLVVGVAAGLTIAFTAMLIAMVISMRQSHLASEARSLADARTILAERQSYRASIAAAAASISQYDTLSASKFLDSAPPSRRNWEWQYLHAQLDDSTVLLHDDAEIAAFVTGDDADHLITLLRDGRIDRWNVRSGERKDIGRVECDNLITAVGARSVQRFAAIINHEQARSASLCLIDARSAQIIAQTPADGINMIAINANGSCVAGRGNGVARLWHPSTPQKPTALPCKVPHPSIAVSDTCRTLLVGADSIDLIDANGAYAQQFGSPTQAVYALAIDTDESHFITGDYFGTIKVFDVNADSHPQTPLSFHAQDGPVRAAMFLGNADRMVTGGSASDSTIRLWDVANGAPLDVFVGCAGGVAQLREGTDHQSIIALDGAGDLRTWSLSRPDPTTVLRGHESYVYGVKFAPLNGASQAPDAPIAVSQLVTTSWDRTIRTWNALTGEPLNVLRGEHGFVTCVDVSPDGRMIVSGHHRGLWTTSEVRLWDVRSGVLLSDLPSHSGEVTTVAFSPDGKRLVTTARNSGARVWEISYPPPAISDHATSALPALVAPPVAEIALLQNPRNGAWEAAWSPDGNALATCYDDGVVIIIDVKTGATVRQWKAHERSVNHLVYSPDGKWIVTTSADALVKLWNATAGELVHTLEGHRDVVWCAAFTPDGSRLATGSTDNTIRIWNVGTGEHLLELRGHDDYIYSLNFSPDGTTLASASGDGTVRLWGFTNPHKR